MNQVITALQELETTVGRLHFERDASALLPEFGIIPTIEEYSDFLTSLTFCKKIAISEYDYIRDEIDRVQAIKADIGRIQKRFNTIQLKVEGRQNTDDQSLENQKQCADKLQETISSFSNSLTQAIENVSTKTEQLKDDLSVFKVVLFGKTKSGKSTVREALTNGQGESIGKGGQSTTTDIHEYDWYNLKIYDTPGSLSVRDTEKKEDGIGEEERKAHDLLLKSDIALFMFTSDNIETAELDYLLDICERGKDVLILLNVKSDLSDYKKFKLRKKDREISAEFQKGNIERILSYRKNDSPAGKAVKDWNPTIIPFHAQAAFFSRGRNPYLESFFRTNDVTRSELYDLSRFSEIRNYLVRNIIERGAAIRSETLRECFISHVIRFSSENNQPIEQCRDNVGRVLKLVLREQEKIEKMISRFDNSIETELNRELRSKINTYELAKLWYDASDSALQSRLNSRLSEEVITQAITNVLQTFTDNICEEIGELSRQLSFNLETDAVFEGFGLSSLPWHDILTLGGMGISAIGFFVGLLASNPIGWIAGIAGAVGAIFSSFGSLFKSKESKIRDCQEKLDKGFNENVRNISGKLQEFCRKELYPKIRSNFDNAVASQNSLLEICEAFSSSNQKLFQIAKKNQDKLNSHTTELIEQQKMLFDRNLQIDSLSANTI